MGLDKNLGRRSFLQLLGLAPAAVFVARKMLPESVAQPVPALKIPPHLSRAVRERTVGGSYSNMPLPKPPSSERLKEALAELNASIALASNHPANRGECWGPRCKSYGKPHHTPWECSITLTEAEMAPLRNAKRYVGTGRA